MSGKKSSNKKLVHTFSHFSTRMMIFSKSLRLLETLGLYELSTTQLSI